MPIDFLTLLSQSNSVLDETQNTIILISPVIEINDDILIDKSCKISSNCNTVIKCNTFEINCGKVSLSDINFEGAIMVKDSNDFSIRNSTITKSKNIDGALTVFRSENVSISHITITESEIPGLNVRMQSSVEADNLDIHDLKESLVVCNSGSKLSLRDSKLHGSKANGVYSGSQLSIEIINCTLTDIEYSAIYAEGTKATIKGCIFTNLNGISLHSSNGFLVEKNAFRKVTGTAISVCDGSKGVVSMNTISKTEGNAVFIKKSEVLLNNNEFSDSLYPAIAVTHKSKASLFDNKISNIEYNGIACRVATDVTIENNEITNVKESAISISDTANCIVRKNTIKNCSISAVEAYNNSKVTVTENTIKSIKNYAFMVYTSGHMKSDKNEIEDVSGAMAKLAFKGSGEFFDNNITNCKNQCEIQTSSDFFFCGNGEFNGITNQRSKSSEKVVFEANRVEEGTMCLRCNGKQSDCYLLDCGHKIYCKECADLALKNGENCPLCRFPIVKVSNGFGVSKDDSCLICCDNQPDCIILPCGHMGVCAKCMESWFETNQVCPICRAENSIYKKIDNF